MIKKITFDTYPINLYVFINQTDEDILAYIGQHGIIGIEEILNFNESEYALFAYTTDSSDIAIRFRDLSKPEIIAHESLHATAYILRHVGVRFSKNSEEAYAYLLQYIVENIYD